MGASTTEIKSLNQPGIAAEELVEPVADARAAYARQPGAEVVGSRGMRRAERRERSRTLCLPDLCMYRYACPVAGPRERYVRSVDCFRQRPVAERPPAQLSEFALRLLAGYHLEREKTP